MSIIEKFRSLIALLAVALTVFGAMMAMVEMGGSVLLVGVFLLLFAELCEISVKLNKVSIVSLLTFSKVHDNM